MIVYGDHQHVAPTRQALATLERDCDLDETTDAPAMVGLISAGMLAQGLLDAAFAARGEDDWGELEEVCATLVVALARTPRDRDRARGALARLDRLELPEELASRVPEGFTFYALDPALYAEAARDFRARFPGPPPVVVGIRSIGVSLAAVVANAAGADDLPVTVRPVGHPFRRELRVGRLLRDRLLSPPPGTRYAVVDEGPGLSGSSFGAVADWLEAHGIARDRIHFFPGHAGDLGPEARPEHRRRWHDAARHVVEFEEYRRRTSSGACWFEDAREAERSEVEEIAGGKWRARHYRSEADWPPAHQFQERRKYLYRLDGRTWLAKFAGFSPFGEIKRARALRLASAGWVPPPRGLRRGFLIEEWRDDARSGPPLRSDPSGRGSLLDAIAGYLAFRAREFPAPDVPGTSPEQLFEMIQTNIRERFGVDWATALGPWKARLPALTSRIRRVITDNRMHAWEWLQLPDGRWLKADALDHAEGHDLIGAQDLAWDVAGACVEHDLDDGERERFEEVLARESPYRPDPLLLHFHVLGYLAFQMGYHAMAAAAHTFNPAEEARHAAATDRYAARLETLLESAGDDGGSH